MVIEAGLEITVKAGGSFIKIDAGGVTVLGPLVKVNGGGTPGSGTGIDIKVPQLPLIVDQARAGRLLKDAPINLPHGGGKSKFPRDAPLFAKKRPMLRVLRAISSGLPC